MTAAGRTGDAWSSTAAWHELPTMGWVWQALLLPNLPRAALNCCCDFCLTVLLTDHLAAI